MIILDHNLARSLISIIHRGFILVLVASSTYFTRKLRIVKDSSFRSLKWFLIWHDLDNNLQSYISLSFKRMLRKSTCQPFGLLEPCSKRVSDFALAGDQIIALTRLWWCGGTVGEITPLQLPQLKSCSIRVLFLLLQEGCREIGHSKPSGKPPRISGKWPN